MKFKPRIKLNHNIYEAIWNPLTGGKYGCDYFWYMSLKAKFIF